MHHIHHTDAFVLGSRPTGEDSKTLFLYTRELGFIRARAQGIRKVSSKLRYGFQDYSRITVDLVRGKEIWRVTTGSPVESYKDIRSNPETDKILVRITSLLTRLLHGEEKSDEIFDILQDTYSLLAVENRPQEDFRPLELLFVTRVLVSLGYLSRETLPDTPEGKDYPLELLDTSYQHKLIRDINQAIAASQL